MTEKEKYFSLQALVCERLPYYAAQLAATAGAGPLVRLQNVKAGKTHSLADLVALVRHSLPQFEMPTNLLPAPAEQQAVAA